MAATGDLSPSWYSLSSNGECTTLTPLDGDDVDDEESICLTSLSVCSDLDQGTTTFGEFAADDIDEHSDAATDEQQQYEVSPWECLPQEFADAVVASGLAPEGSQLQWCGWHNIHHYTESTLCSFECYAGPEQPLGTFVMQKVIVPVACFDTDSQNILAAIGQGIEAARPTIATKRFSTN